MGCTTLTDGGGTLPAEASADLAALLREQQIISLLQCLLKEQRRTNAYLSAMIETEIEDPEIEL